MSNTRRAGRSKALAESYAADYRCPDCASETELLELASGVFRLEVRHDDTCPFLAMIKGTSS